MFNRIYSWVADKNAGIDITASRMDTDTDDITSNGFGNTLTRDGQGSATANLPMNGFRHTGVGNGVARTDYAAMGQLQDGVIDWAVDSGAADAMAVSLSPSVTALVDGQLVFARANHANTTTTPTLSVNGLTAHTITKSGGTAVVAGDIPAALAECIFRYNLANARFELLNPASGVTGPGSATDGHLAVFNGSTGHIIKDGGAFQIAAAQLTSSAMMFGSGMINGTIVQSQAGNAQTFAIKTLANADPSASDPVYFLFRDATAATGDFLVRTVTAALNITIPSGQAIGFSNATPGRVWLGALDNAGTVELFVVNCLTGTSLYPLRGFGIISTSAVAGAASSGVAYSTTARTSKAYLTLGYATWEVGGTLGTAGTWNTAPTRLQIYQPGTVPLPGSEIQRQENFTGAQANGATAIPNDDTIPQSTEGTQFMTQAITPTSSANLLRIEGLLNLSSAVASITAATALFQDSTANALAVGSFGSTASGLVQCLVGWSMLSATLSSTTFKLRAGDNAGHSYTLNGESSARIYGGTSASYMRVVEIMA